MVTCGVVVVGAGATTTGAAVVGGEVGTGLDVVGVEVDPPPEEVAAAPKELDPPLTDALPPDPVRTEVTEVASAGTAAASTAGPEAAVVAATVAAATWPARGVDSEATLAAVRWPAACPGPAARMPTLAAIAPPVAVTRTADAPATVRARCLFMTPTVRPEPTAEAVGTVKSRQTPWAEGPDPSGRGRVCATLSPCTCCWSRTTTPSPSP